MIRSARSCTRTSTSISFPPRRPCTSAAYAHVWPRRIPGTSKVLFTSWTTAEAGGARILDLDTGEMRPLAVDVPDQRFTPTVRWSASGHLVFENWDAGLSVMPFDPASDERVSIADARPLLGDVEVDLRRGISRQLTFHAGNDLEPVYFPDGDRVLYSSNRDARWSLWTVGRGSAATPEMLLQRDENVYALDVSVDGTILFEEQSQDTGDDIYLRMPDGEVRALVVAPSDEKQAVFSTDGQWVAYQSDLSGRFEVYLTNVDGTAPPVQVSSGGGTAPRFGPGGQTLYFRRHRQVLRVGFVDGQPIGKAEQVFDAPNLDFGRSYDFVADESRMVAVQVDDDAVPTALRVVTDFFHVIEDVFAERSRQASGART